MECASAPSFTARLPGVRLAAQHRVGEPAGERGRVRRQRGRTARPRPSSSRRALIDERSRPASRCGSEWGPDGPTGSTEDACCAPDHGAHEHDHALTTTTTGRLMRAAAHRPQLPAQWCSVFVAIHAFRYLAVLFAFVLFERRRHRARLRATASLRPADGGRRAQTVVAPSRSLLRPCPLGGRVVPCRRSSGPTSPGPPGQASGSTHAGFDHMEVLSRPTPASRRASTWPPAAWRASSARSARKQVAYVPSLGSSRGECSWPRGRSSRRGARVEFEDSVPRILRRYFSASAIAISITAQLQVIVAVSTPLVTCRCLPR